MNRDNSGRFVRSPLTFAQRVEAEVWADLEAKTAMVHHTTRLNYQERGAVLTEFIDQAAERLHWLEGES